MLYSVSHFNGTQKYLRSVLGELMLEAEPVTMTEMFPVGIAMLMDAAILPLTQGGQNQPAGISWSTEKAHSRCLNQSAGLHGTPTDAITRLHPI